MAADQKIRIRLKAYDHEVIDQSTKKIVETVTRTQAQVRGPVPLPTEKHASPSSARPQGQGLPRALRDADPQAADRHHRAVAQDRRLAAAPRPAAGVDIEIKIQTASRAPRPRIWPAVRPLLVSLGRHGRPFARVIHSLATPPGRLPEEDRRRTAGRGFVSIDVRVGRTDSFGPEPLGTTETPLRQVRLCGALA